MSSTTPTVIVFGASGAVGRAAAIEAESRGARVFLAMRNTAKPIPGLSSEVEEKGNFKRIQADLSDTDSIRKAAAESGATSAFNYVVHMAPDAMRGAFAAMKEGGIKRVVFLSSFTVCPDAETAVANGGAIANIRGEVADAKNGEIHLLRPEGKSDYIAPEDIGSVAGARLVEQTTEPEIIHLCGPKLLSQRETWEIVSKELGHEIKIKELSEEEFLGRHNLPRPLAQSLADYWLNDAIGQYPEERVKEASGNILKYTGRQPIEFADWIKAHKSEIFG
ncbi:NmrA-like family protein [Colletotrichum sojae]|uniref:NmrA-like family protein n=1 Tax=Colletotrichum sojae TaxID=2175907 RepID=A0A8H6JHK1_9PEZI|nr:NmrA-like family protein [Colletotrichum sojae]